MWRITSLALTLVPFFLGGTLHAQEKPVKLPKKVKQALQQHYLPGIARQNLNSIVLGAEQIVRRSDEQGFQKVEAYLTSARQPTITETLPLARIKLASLGITEGLPEPGIRELEIGIPQILKEIEKVKKFVAQFPLAQERIKSASNWREYENLLWTSHVLQNRMQNAETAMRWIVKSTRQLKADSRVVKKLSEKQLELLDADYVSKLKEVKTASTNLKEGDLELRIYRMEDAVRTLSNKESKSVDRLDAAFAIEQDSVVFNRAVKKHKGNNTWFKRPNLKDNSVVSSVNELMISGRKYGGDWQAKASLLKLAIHWWQRGRFGKGPEITVCLSQELH